MKYPSKIDLHMHTTVSDGTDTPEEILERVKEAGLELFAVTDHDAVKAGTAIRKIWKQRDPVFITGVEFSCRDDGGKYHILGYGIDPESEKIKSVLETGHGYRMEKVHARIEALEREFGFIFPEEDLEKLYSLDNPGKPHIGNLMVDFGYAPTKDVAITQYINRIKYESKYVTPGEAIKGILDSGGIPVLAHPPFGNGSQHIVGEELNRRIQYLKDMGLKGVEAFYSGFSKELCSEVLALAEKEEMSLLVTAGSDYHGRNKTVRLGETGCEDAAQGPEGMRRFLEEIAEKCTGSY